MGSDFMRGRSEEGMGEGERGRVWFRVSLGAGEGYMYAHVQYTYYTVYIRAHCAYTISVLSEFHFHLWLHVQLQPCI